MSRIGNSPIELPAGVDVTVSSGVLSAKGKLGELSMNLHQAVSIEQADNQLHVRYDAADSTANMMSGTTRALVANMVQGVSVGFERKLVLVGVGYRVQLKGNDIDLSIGVSHPVVVTLPEGVKAESPSQTELVLKGINKQKVNQMAANIRALRPPEPYKGKGIRYSDEVIVLKEGKKK